MKIQKICPILLKGLLYHRPKMFPAWRGGVAVVASQFGGDYKIFKGLAK